MATVIYACRVDGDVFEPALSELDALIADPQVNVWVSLAQGGESERRLLVETFKLHELLVEDALSAASTPKAEIHDNCLYLIVHGLVPGKAMEGRTVDVDFFLGDGLLVTHHADGLPSLDIVRKQIAEDPELLRMGPAFVMHRLMDLMIDEYLPLMAKLNEEIAEIENAVLRRPGPELLERIFRIKHTLQRLRRVGIHQKDILHRLATGAYPRIPGPVRPFFRDVEDHFVRVMDLNESYRDLVASSMDAYLSMQSHKLNEVMKSLTGISTIMLPLMFITGLYGMNFDHMPGLHWNYGYEAAWAVMLTVAGGSYAWMKRRDWL